MKETLIIYHGHLELHACSIQSLRISFCLILMSMMRIVRLFTSLASISDF